MRLLPAALAFASFGAYAMAIIPEKNPLDTHGDEEDQSKGRVCQPWGNKGIRTRWFWREFYNDYQDGTQAPYNCLKKGTCANNAECEAGSVPPNGCIEQDKPAKIHNITDVTNLEKGLSKRVLFSALKMARESGDLTRFQWIHGLQPNAVVNHFTSFFLPWHRKYQIEYENVLRAQWKVDPDCPGCREYYSCVTSPAWNWADDQSTCEAARAPVYHSKTTSSIPKDVVPPFARKYNSFDGTHTMGQGCNTYDSASQFVHDFGGAGSPNCSTSPFCKYSDKLSLDGGPMCKDPSDPDVQHANRENATHANLSAASWGPIKCDEVTEEITGRTIFPQDKLYTKGFTNNPYDARIGCLTKGPFAGWTYPSSGLEEPNISNDKGQNCLGRATDYSINSNNAVFTSEERLADLISSRDSYSPVDFSLDGVTDNSNPNSGFRYVLETIPHGVPHTFIGGNMISYESIGDPMFLGHHSMIEAAFEFWQDCHDLDIISKLEDFQRDRPHVVYHPDSIQLYNDINLKGRKGVLRSEMGKDHRARRAYGPYVEISTGRYNRGNNYGVGGHKSTTYIDHEPANVTLTNFTSATEIDGPYTTATNGRDGIPSSTDRYPFDTAWPNYKADKTGVIIDGDIEEKMMFAFPNTSVVNHCFLGPQFWTIDGLDTFTGEEGNNECYECIIKQHGPNGLLKHPGVNNKPNENDCRARGFDSGQTVNEDYCQMFCGMPECEEKCNVHHHSWNKTTLHGAEDPDTTKDHPTTRYDLRTYDQEHTRVGDYMDSELQPAYDVVTNQHYFVNVQYSVSNVVQLLVDTNKCTMDNFQHLKPAAKTGELGLVAQMLQRTFSYTAVSPVADSTLAVEGPLIGAGHLKLTNIHQPSGWQPGEYSCDGTLSGAGIGCDLKVKPNTCVIRKSKPFLTTTNTFDFDDVPKIDQPDLSKKIGPSYLINFEMINEECSGVKKNVWHYKYSGFVTEGDENREGMPQKLSYQNLNPSHAIVGTVIRVLGHYDDKPAGQTPWKAGTGFTETTTAATTPYARGKEHQGGEVAIFSAFHL